jgi:hypothetical protein
MEMLSNFVSADYDIDDGDARSGNESATKKYVVPMTFLGLRVMCQRKKNKANNYLSESKRSMTQKESIADVICPETEKRSMTDLGTDLTDHITSRSHPARMRMRTSAE